MEKPDKKANGIKDPKDGAANEAESKNSRRPDSDIKIKKSSAAENKKTDKYNSEVVCGDYTESISGKTENPFIKSLKIALILSLPLTMLIFSITYNLSFGLELSGNQLIISIIIASAALIMWCGASIWSVFLRIKFIPRFSLLIWGVCIISYVVTYSVNHISQSEFAFGYLASVLYSPSYSFYPIASALSSGEVSFFVTMLIFPLAVCLVSAAALIIIKRRGKANG